MTIVLSEKNRGVEAVSEKLKPEQYMKTLSFGSDNMGVGTKAYIIENKLEYHPLVTDAHKHLHNIETQCEQKIRKLKRLVYNVLPRHVHKKLVHTNIIYIKKQLEFANMKDCKKNKK